MLSQVDSEATGSRQWTGLSTGAIQAPSDARSARVRLMLRPSGNTAAAWDDVAMVTTTAATPTPAPTATPEPTQPSLPPGTLPTGTPAPGETPPPAGEGTVTPPGTDDGDTGPPPPANGDGRTTVDVVAGEPPEGGPLLLSEVMSDPDTPEENTLNEWVEVLNVSDNPVDLAGWVIADRQRGVSLPSLIIYPGERGIIAASEADVPGGVPHVRVATGRIGYGLRNPGDAVLLFAPSGTLVDAMSYGDNDAYGPGQPPAPPTGETLGRAFEDGHPGPWQLTLYPAPGEPNVFPGEPTDDGAPMPAATPTSQVAGSTVEPADDSAADEELADEAAAPGTSDPPGTMSPIAWIVLGAAVGTAIVGIAPLAPRGLRRVKAWKRRGG